MRKTVVLGLVCFLAACGDRPMTESGTVIKVSLDQMQAPQAEVLRVVPLETTQETLLGQNLSVIATPDNFIANDREKIVIFNKDGKIRGVIRAQGNSDKEYIRLANIDVYKDTLYVLDYVRSRMMRFSLDGDSLVALIHAYDYAENFQNLQPVSVSDADNPVLVVYKL